MKPLPERHWLTPLGGKRKYRNRRAAGRTRRVQIQVKGRTYPSLNSAAGTLGVSTWKLYDMVKRGEAHLCAPAN